jgi:hypothetical protein
MMGCDKGSIIAEDGRDGMIWVSVTNQKCDRVNEISITYKDTRRFKNATDTIYCCDWVDFAQYLLRLG